MVMVTHVAFRGKGWFGHIILVLWQLDVFDIIPLGSKNKGGRFCIPKMFYKS